MAHRLDTIAIGIAQERRIIRRMIVAQARRAVIGAAGGDTRTPERVDLAAPARLEAPMIPRGLLGVRTPIDRDVDAIGEVRPGPRAVAQPIIAATDLDHA